MRSVLGFVSGGGVSQIIQLGVGRAVWALCRGPRRRETLRKHKTFVTLEAFAGESEVGYETNPNALQDRFGFGPAAA